MLGVQNDSGIFVSRCGYLIRESLICKFFFCFSGSVFGSRFCFD